MLDESFYLRSFIERMMRINRGRAFFTTPDTLGDYVLVDFLEQRRANRRGEAPAVSSGCGERRFVGCEGRASKQTKRTSSHRSMADDAR